MLVMALTFVIVIPALGILYVDMQNATVAATAEVKRMQSLRKALIDEYRSTKTKQGE